MEHKLIKTDASHQLVILKKNEVKNNKYLSD